MNPERRRRTRLISALSVALVLAGALAYTSFSQAAAARSPSQLRDAVPGQAYQVTGTVLPGYVRRGSQLIFRLADRNSSGAGSAVTVRYKGEVPDPFRAGREVIVTVDKSGGSFVGQPGSLVTKCPSKFASAPSVAPANSRGG